MRGRAHRHLAAAAHLVVTDAQRVLHFLIVQLEQAPRCRRARDKAEQLRGEPALGHGPVGNVDTQRQTRMDIGTRDDGGDEIFAVHRRSGSGQFFRNGKPRGDGGDADVPPIAHIVVIQHMSEAAIHKGCPWRGRLAAKAPDRGFRLAAEVTHILMHQPRFFVDAASANGDPERV